MKSGALPLLADKKTVPMHLSAKTSTETAQTNHHQEAAMSLNLNNMRTGFATEASADLGVFLEFEEDAGETFFRIAMDHDLPSVKDMHVVRDMLTAAMAAQTPKLTLAPDPSDSPVVVSCVNVAGVQVSEYQSTEDGVTVALETDEVVPVRSLPELIAFLQSVEKDHRLAAARDFFGSADALDPAKHTMQSLMEYAETHGYDVPAFLTVACEVMDK